MAKRDRGDRPLLAVVMAAILSAAWWSGAVSAGDAPASAPGMLSDRAEEARRLKDQGDEHASRDRAAEAILAYQAAVVADPSLGPEIAPSLGAQLLWADRTAEAVPVLEAAVARNPSDRETRKLLALAYRWSDRLDDAERLSRMTLAEEPGDLDERNGLAIALLWQGRNRQAAAEFDRVLAARPDDTEALTGLSRARLEMDLPDDAAAPATRAVAIDPKNREAAKHLDTVRRRLTRYLEGEIRGSYDTDQLALWKMSLGAHGRPARGLDVGVVATELLFRQGSPGKEENIGALDSANGTAGTLTFAYRPGPSWTVRGSAGVAWYDVADFHPWTGSAGGTYFPGDLWRFALDWERVPYDTILSLQNRVTIDAVTATVTRLIPWKTEVTASASYREQRNENETGQQRTNPGQQYELGLSRRLYMKDEVTRLTGLLRLGYLGYRYDLDVGVYDPLRQTTEEVGVDGRWAFRPQWAAFGTAMAGAQQEKREGGSPSYSLEAGVDREVGAAGRITLGGFIADSSAAGRGGGYRRQGGYLRFRVTF
ncbi:MAG: tetratricopeptide repeat protein [Candidatus Deferrimicrobiaceae bacterium]